MKKIADKVLSPQVFALCYLPWLAINMASVINILDFTRVVLAVFALWAVAVCVKVYFFSGKTPWTDKWIALLLAFLAACLLSQVLQFRYGGVDMIGKLCYFSLCILLLYSQHGNKCDDYEKLFGRMVRVLGIVIGLMILVSDWMFIELFMDTVTGRSGATVKIGFSENRLFGIFTSPNVGGAFALILLWCSFLTLKWAKKMRSPVLWRVIACIQIFLGGVYISVALSRGTYLAGIALVASYLLIRQPFEKEKNLKLWKQILVRVTSALLALVICAVSLEVLNWAACEVMVWNYERKVAADQSQDSEEKQEIIDSALQGSDGRVESGRDDIDITNKRASIWKNHLQLLEGKHLLIGVNQPKVYLEKNLAAGKTFTKDQLAFVRYASGNLHNGYLQILINGGLLALLPMVAFLVLCAIKAIRYLSGALFSGRLAANSVAYELFSLTLPMVLAVLVNNVVETNFVLMGANFIQAFFWFVAGACVQSMNEGVKK